MNTLRAHLRTAVIAAVLMTVVLNTSAPALASTLSDKRAQAAAVQTQIAALTAKQEIASEQYNAARGRYQALTVKVAATQARIGKLQAQTATLQSALANQADAMYRDDGNLGVIAALLSARSFEDLNSTIELITRIGEQNASTIDQLKGLQQEAAAQKRELVVAQTAAGVQQTAMAANAATVRARLADSQHIYASLSADIKTILAQQAAAEAAAAAARARALLNRAHSGGSSGSGGSGAPSFDPGGNPPSSSKGAAAVWWAEKELGRPYEWGAAGPNSFDCSGLVMWAYAHVGISLPHYSGGQINAGARVSKSNLQPGDLVFFGSPIHHVGMYIGGGEFIEAPHTGANVRIATLGDRYDYAGACRP